ncbi:hypothetical protein GGF40_004167 [Coemansia sp. RSA 1286]|nr:hypothetical protein GGF40_004167 [Coemansia sp. RSA 1286]
MRDFQHRELQRIRALASGVGGTKARSSVAARRLCGGCGVRPGGRGRRASLVCVVGVRRWRAPSAFVVRAFALPPARPSPHARLLSLPARLLSLPAHAFALCRAGSAPLQACGSAA